MKKAWCAGFDLMDDIILANYVFSLPSPRSYNLLSLPSSPLSPSLPPLFLFADMARETFTTS